MLSVIGMLSTPYSYAKEMLAQGRGLLAEFRDADSIADCIAYVLDNPNEKKKMELRTLKAGESMMWENIAAEYIKLCADIIREYRRFQSSTGSSPAESPSTMKTSHSSGFVDWQSDSLPGNPPPPIRPLRPRARSRALWAAIRADAAACARRTMSRPSAGFCSSQAPNWSLTTFCTKPLASVLPSLVLVWPSNCGSANLIEMMAVRPSRASSPGDSVFLLLDQVPGLTPLLIRPVSAERKPSSWVPPSWVLMVLAKVCTDSV